MKQEFIELLKQLIACTPVSADIPAVNRASAVMEEFLQAHGVRVVREVIDGRNTLYASLRPEGKETEVLFNAHLDVVPLSTPDQNQAVIRNGRLYGRGAGDCLGQAVVIAQILCANPGKSAAAIFTTNEEIGGSTTTEMLARGYHGTRGAIILDAWFKNAVACAEKGMMDVQITAHGKSGHAAHPWEAINAIDLLMEGYRKLHAAWQNPVSEKNWEDTISATEITCSSTAHNVIPETASLCCNIRFIQPGAEAEIIKKIQTLTGLDDVKLLNSCVPVFCNEENEFLQSYRRIAKKITGRECGIQRMHGATDARHIAALYPELPIVVTGAHHGNIHNTDEWLDLDDTDTIIRICSEVLE